MVFQDSPGAVGHQDAVGGISPRKSIVVRPFSRSVPLFKLVFPVRVMVPVEDRLILPEPAWRRILELLAEVDNLKVPPDRIRISPEPEAEELDRVNPASSR